ncbi:CBS domain-containing protein [Trichophyton tonsurans CBS 112818]|uniref:CBS domain-containing protein n=1 Tax=Trichophyton tonsurans (strain CBS 112818) TaxID=647933 RepID=F2RR78_TRIT1|nr:CBS domain-containing protein [Trichophyton tonsurans CBS 112818]
MTLTRGGGGLPAGLALTKLVLCSLSRLPLLYAAPLTSSAVEKLAHVPKPPDEFSLWLYLSIAAALVLSGGAFAGLTIALMGQDEIYLQVIQTSGEGEERKQAAKVLDLLKKGKHWVLVTLLLSNVVVNETLPIVLDRSLGGGWPAVVGSTALIVIFGEVVPQSICVRYGLPIGAWMASAVLCLMYITSPLSYPIAKLLDRLLGEDHGTFYKKAGLKTLVTLHKNLGTAGDQLNSDEVTIISAVLDLKEKSVGSIMIPMEDVFIMSADTVLDEKMMDLILSQGYSRIPIHAPDNPQNFVGMLLVKMLITYDPEDCKRVRDFALATLPETRAETSCLDIVNFFQEGKAHMVLVSDYPGEDHGSLGVVTLEDVIEELIGEEIIDESDVFIDVHKAIRRMAPAPKFNFPKGHFVEVPPSAHDIGVDTLTTTRTTDSEQQNEHTQLSKNATHVGSPPPPTFYLRQTPVVDKPDGSRKPIIQRGATAEIKEQLKHLGPSNLASRPRQTRYNAVKINEVESHLRDVQPSESDSLLVKSISERAVNPREPASYGTTTDQSHRPLYLPYSTTEPNIKQDNAAVPRTSSPPQTQNTTTATTDSLPTIHGPSPSKNGTRSPSANSDTPSSSTIFHPRGPTRSGSITEQVVDIHGIRKVVLQTSDRNLSECDSNQSVRPSSSSQTSDTKESADLEHTTGEQFTHQSNGSNSASGKKRRRRKRKPTGSSKDDDQNDESQHLLD